MRRPAIDYRIVVGVVFVAALSMSILDSTVVNVAVPTIGREFGALPSQVGWVVVGYLLSLAVCIPASGWIGDRFGTKRTFLVALAIFTSASVLCGVAGSLEQLILFRVLQGVGGGMLTPVGTTMLWRAFPPAERARASQVLIVPTVIAPALGPIIGGLLVTNLSWRWAFYVNVPVGIATFCFGAWFLVEHREPRTGRFDVAGFVLSGLALSLALFAMEAGPSEGWTTPRTIACVVGAALAAALLVRVELSIAEPMLKLRLLADRLFRTTNLVSACDAMAFLGMLFIVPLYLQVGLGHSALESGLTTFAEAVGVLTASQLAGRLYGSVGPRRLMVGGMLVMAMAMSLLIPTDGGTDLWVLRGIMFTAGLGKAFVVVPLQAATFATIASRDTGRASAIYVTQRQMAAALGVALLATVLVSVAGANSGVTGSASQLLAFRICFAVDAAIALLGALAASRVHDADAASTMRTRTPPRGAGRGHRLGRAAHLSAAATGTTGTPGAPRTDRRVGADECGQRGRDGHCDAARRVGDEQRVGAGPLAVGALRVGIGAARLVQVVRVADDEVAVEHLEVEVHHAAGVAAVPRLTQVLATRHRRGAPLCRWARQDPGCADDRSRCTRSGRPPWS